MAYKNSTTPSGLRVSVDQLIYERAEEHLSCSKPHAFVYHLTIHNNTNRSIKLFGRKWIIQELSEISIIEGDGVIGKTPNINPGKYFSYHSYHITSTDASAQGMFYGIDEWNNLVHIKIPRFNLIIPRK